MVKVEDLKGKVVIITGGGGAIGSAMAKQFAANGAKVLVLGLTFKENTPDLRNTRVVDIVEALRGYNAQVDIHDPWVDAAEARHE